MSTNGVTVTECSFEGTDCGRGSHPYYLADTLRVDAQTYLIDHQVLCGHCHEVIYPEVKILQHHRIVCDGEAQVWFLYDGPPHGGGSPLMVMHRCGWPAMTATDEEFLDLLAEEVAR